MVHRYARQGELNLAGFHPSASCLGPGKRCILWVQGCLMRCPKCVALHMQPLVDRTWVDIPFLARLIGSIEGIEGITVVGGEPMLQAQAMTSLLKAVHEDYGLSSMLYTGYRLESLIEMQDADIADLLSRIDILVDGPYVEELDYSQRWRGSENQTIHFVTDRYSDLQGVMNERGRDIEIHIDEQGNYLVLGIPPKGFYEKLEHLNEQTIYRR